MGRITQYVPDLGMLKSLRLTPFDGLVIATLLSLMTLTAFIVWRGDQIGADVLSFAPSMDNGPVSVFSTVEVTFAQSMAADSSDMPLRFSPPVSGTVRWQGNSLRFSPLIPFEPDTIYTATLDGQLLSQRGRPLLETSSWEFMTRQPHVVYIAFDENEYEQLYTLDPNEGTPRALTAEPQGVFDYTLSPDSQILAYSAWNDQRGRDLWAIDLTTQERYTLLECPEAACNGVAWHPDGQRLVYERRAMLIPGAAPGPPRLWWLNVGSGQTVPMFDDNQVLGYGATWASNGNWLSFVAPSSQGVQAYNITDGQSVLIPSRTGAIPVWNPAGDTLILSDIRAGDEGFAAHLFRANPTAGELTPISGEGSRVEDSSPAWSPDGQRLAFARKIAGTAMGKQICIMHPDGSEIRFLTDEPDIHHGLPAWSPDGRYLLFQRFSLKDLGGSPSIWLMEMETETMTELANQGSQPNWLP